MSEPIYVAVGVPKVFPHEPQAVHDLFNKCEYHILDVYINAHQIPADKIYRVNGLNLYAAESEQIYSKVERRFIELVKGKSVIFVTRATIDNMTEYFDMRRRMEVLSESIKESLIPTNYEK